MWIYKWLNSQLNKLKSTVKNQTGVTLRVNIKIFEGNNSEVPNHKAPLGIIAVAVAINAEIQKKIRGSRTATLIISNEEINEIMKIVQASWRF